MSREIEKLKDAAGYYRRWALEARKKYIELRLRQDPEIRSLYIRAADRAAQELRRLALKTPSSYLRKRQLEELEAALRAEAERLADNLTKVLEEYIEQAVDAGAGYSQAVTLDLLKKAGIDTTGLRTMFATVNRQAVEACWARTEKGLFLSDRIWQQGETFRNTMRDLIQESVAIGQDAVKTARMLQQYVRQGAQTLARDYPKMMERMKGRVPGDICYEALRLVRTETTAAFGEGTIAAARVSPSYKGMKWVLSKSHPITDICDTLAAHDEGLGEGVYSPGNEPPYPAHPSCLCILVPVHEEPEKFVERLKKWREDPDSDVKLEKWYNDIYQAKQNAGIVKKPAFLRIDKHNQQYDDALDRKQIENDLALIPDKHRELLKKHGVTIQTGYDVSRYDRKNKVIQVGKNPVLGEVIHEVGHAIETILDLYNDKKFIKVLYEGTEAVSFENVIYDKDTFGRPIIRLEIDKLISEYQGRLYEDVGIFTDKMKVNIMAMREYFSEGYREFLINPDNLKHKDRALYDFIKGVI